MLYNYRLRISGLAKTKYFCEIMNVTPELLSKDVLVEVNTHPWMENNIVMDSCAGENLMDLKKKHLPISHLETYQSIGRNGFKLVLLSIYCFYQVMYFLQPEMII